MPLLRVVVVLAGPLSQAESTPRWCRWWSRLGMTAGMARRVLPPAPLQLLAHTLDIRSCHLRHLPLQGTSCQKV
jgi:hypothetical protein